MIALGAFADWYHPPVEGFAVMLTYIAGQALLVFGVLAAARSTAAGTPRRDYVLRTLISNPAARSRSTRASPMAVAGVSTPAASGSVSPSNASASADSPSITAVAAYPGSPCARTRAAYGRRCWWWCRGRS